MPGLLLCEPTELYNILNQATKLSRLTEPNYLCLFDVRSKWEYDESHVITALRVKKKNNEYLLPESVDLECVKYCVVYDNNTSTLEVLLKDDDDDSDSDSAGKDVVPGAAIEYGRILTRLTRHPVYILKGGYERFSGTYHFLRTQKIIWMPQELDAFQPYPIEIMPGEVFLGNFSQACDPKIQKDLKIKAHVNVSMDTGPFFAGDPDRLLHIRIEDAPEAQILPFLRHVCHFIDVHRHLGSVILIFSTQGISRSCATIIAYLMHYNEQTLQVCVPRAGLTTCHPLGGGVRARPGRSGALALLWEEESQITPSLGCPPAHVTQGQGPSVAGLRPEAGYTGLAQGLRPGQAVLQPPQHGPHCCQSVHRCLFGVAQGRTAWSPRAAAQAPTHPRLSPYALGAGSREEREAGTHRGKPRQISGLLTLRQRLFRVSAPPVTACS
uniref:Serine/threonine/tyrosine interacting like 1 n=1 Tax=Macaca mulatta TaxID=9544 RepID=F7GP47_MACMU